jgi:hypothetical protein
MLPQPSDSKIWSWLQWYSEPKITVLARASSNLACRHLQMFASGEAFTVVCSASPSTTVLNIPSITTLPDTLIHYSLSHYFFPWTTIFALSNTCIRQNVVIFQISELLTLCWNFHYCWGNLVAVHGFSLSLSLSLPPLAHYDCVRYNLFHQHYKNLN